MDNNNNVSRDVSEEGLTKLRKEFEAPRKKIEKFGHLESSDVSSRSKREQQQKRDKKKKEDGATVTHQQRNPGSGNRSTSNRKKEKSGNRRPRSAHSKEQVKETKKTSKLDQNTRTNMQSHRV